MVDLYDELKALPIRASRIVELLWKERERREADLVHASVGGSYVEADDCAEKLKTIDAALAKFKEEITSDVLSILEANGAMMREQEAKANG